MRFAFADASTASEGSDMEWLDVLQRIEAGENRRTEFKRGLGDLSDIGKAICAFGNGDGGLIVLGVDDAGTIVGVKEDEERVQERLTGFLQSGCSVPVSARSGRHEDPNGWVHWIEVPRQPRRFEPLHYDGRFWIRRERSSVPPSPTERQELFNDFGFVLTEEQVIRAATIEDIDHDAFRAFLRAQGLDTDEEPQPPLEEDMRNAGLLAIADGSLHPTLYGVMVFGRDPQNHPQTSSFFIQCAAYAGLDRAAEVVSVADAKGRLEDQINRAMGWCRILGRREIYRGITREDVPLIPDSALREALVNAVIHREYAITGSSVMFEVFSDRIDVTSPGTLPNHMEVESVRAGSRPRSRNESMAHAMVVTKLMERRGRGWPLMRRIMREFNGTEPDILNEERGKFVRVTFRLDQGAN